MDKDDSLLDNLTPATIHQIAWQVREREHDPKEARRLLLRFVDLIDRNQNVPAELVRHLRDSLADYLEGTDLKVAFGLTKGKKRSSIDEYTGCCIARDYWARRLQDNVSHQVAIQDLAAQYGWGATNVGEVYKRYRTEGLVLHRMRLRDESGRELTEEEGTAAQAILEGRRPPR